MLGRQDRLATALSNPQDLAEVEQRVANGD